MLREVMSNMLSSVLGGVTDYKPCSTEYTREAYIKTGSMQIKKSQEKDKRSKAYGCK